MLDHSIHHDRLISLALGDCPHFFFAGVSDLGYLLESADIKEILYHI